MTETLRESVVVEADPDTVLDFVADFEAYPDWQEDVQSVEVLDADADGWATRVRFEVDAGIMGAWLVLAYTYGDNEMSWVLEESDKLKVNDGRYLLEDLGDGTTRVTYELEAAPKIPVPKRLRDQFSRKIIAAALDGVKREVEARS